MTTLDNQIVSEPPASSTGASSHVPTALARLLAPSAVAPPTDETQGSAKKLRSADQSESTNLADSISIVRAVSSLECTIMVRYVSDCFV